MTVTLEDLGEIPTPLERLPGPVDSTDDSDLELGASATSLALSVIPAVVPRRMDSDQTAGCVVRARGGQLLPSLASLPLICYPREPGYACCGPALMRSHFPMARSLKLLRDLRNFVEWFLFFFFADGECVDERVPIVSSVGSQLGQVGFLSKDAFPFVEILKLFEDLFVFSRRDPASYVKPKNTVTDSNNNVDPGTDSGSRSEIEKMTPHVSRHIFLIRHGHYNINGEADEERGLTELGK